MSSIGAMRDKIEQIKALPKHRGVTFWVGCFKMGGHGDSLTLCAFARAAKRYWQDKLGAPNGSGPVSRVVTSWDRAEPDSRPHEGERVGVIAIRRVVGMPDDYDVGGAQRGIDACLGVPEVGWPWQAAGLAPCFDVFYDVRYTARAIFRDQERFTVEAGEARDSLDHYRWLHDGFPWACSHMDERCGMSQWDLMSITAGFDVTPDDLYVSTTTPVIGKYGTSALPLNGGYDGCVTIHNGEGGKGRTKTMPRDVPNLITEALAGNGFQVVQVGCRDNVREPTIRGAADLRGLRFTETAALIAKARLHVDVEGGLVYVAKAVGTQSCVFFGPTPRSVFAFHGNRNYSRGICPEGPCWWSHKRWPHECKMGFKNCVNFPQAETAAHAVLQTIGEQGGPQVEMTKTRVVE